MTPAQEIQLYEYISGLVGVPFAYGKNDCPLLAAGVLDCMDGGVRRNKMTGLWSDKTSAWKYMRKHGDIEAHLIKNGCVQIAGGLNFAQPGDLILMERTIAHDRKWHSVGVCLGASVAVMTEEIGLTKIKAQNMPPIKQVFRWPSQQ